MFGLCCGPSTTLVTIHTLLGDVQYPVENIEQCDDGFTASVIDEATGTTILEGTFNKENILETGRFTACGTTYDAADHDNLPILSKSGRVIGSGKAGQKYLVEHMEMHSHAHGLTVSMEREGERYIINLTANVRAIDGGVVTNERRVKMTCENFEELLSTLPSRACGFDIFGPEFDVLENCEKAVQHDMHIHHEPKEKDLVNDCHLKDLTQAGAFFVDAVTGYLRVIVEKEVCEVRLDEDDDDVEVTIEHCAENPAVKMIRVDDHTVFNTVDFRTIRLVAYEKAFLSSRRVEIHHSTSDVLHIKAAKKEVTYDLERTFALLDIAYNGEEALNRTVNVANGCEDDEE